MALTYYPTEDILWSTLVRYVRRYGEKEQWSSTDCFIIAGSIHNDSPSMFPVFTNSSNDSLSESQISWKTERRNSRFIRCI